MSQSGGVQPDDTSVTKPAAGDIGDTGAAWPDNEALIAFLKRLGAEMERGGPGQKPIIYAANNGNAGDSLIAAATFQVFRQAGLRWRLIDGRNTDPALTAGETVLYSGGGNLVPFYDGARRFLAAHHGGAGRLVLLPHSIGGHEDLLRSLGGNVDLIARDPGSLAHIEASAGGARCHLMPDIAFGADMADLRRGPLHLFGQLPPDARSAARLAWYGYKRLRKPRPPGGALLNAMRTDRESGGRALPEDNFDLSQIYVGWVAPESAARWAARDFIAILDRYETVRTNRLHVGLAAALLRKRVLLHDNNYGKVRSIWAHSMAGCMPHVEWQD